MKLSYRIKKIKFISAQPIFVAQYKILGVWLNIDFANKGHFGTPSRCYCEQPEHAQKRIQVHAQNMERAKEWWDKVVSYIRVS